MAAASRPSAAGSGPAGSGRGSPPRRSTRCGPTPTAARPRTGSPVSSAPLAESLGALRAAEADGLIGGYGVSNFDARQLAAALEAAAPQAIQNSYSLLARQDERELLPLCAQRGVADLAFSPLAGSRMTQRPQPYAGFVCDQTFAALARLRTIATGRGTPSPDRSGT